MTQYARGRRFEWKLAAQLKAAGAIVMRSAGSHGEADLVALWGNEAWAIQAKTRKPTAAELRKIVKASKRSAAAWWLMVWPDGRGIVYRQWLGGRELGYPRTDYVDWELRHKGMAGE